MWMVEVYWNAHQALWTDQIFQTGSLATAHVGIGSPATAYIIIATVLHFWYSDPWVFFSVSQKWGHWVFLVKICQRWVVLDDFLGSIIFGHLIFLCMLGKHLTWMELKDLNPSNSWDFCWSWAKISGDYPFLAAKVPMMGSVASYGL